MRVADTPFAPITSGKVLNKRDGLGVRILETLHAPRTILAPHDHEDVSVDIALEGWQEERVGCRTVSRGPGSILIRPAGIRHSNAYGRYVTRSVCIQLPITSPVLAEWGAGLFGSFRHACDAGATVVGRRIVSLLDAPPSLSALELEETVTILLSELSNRCSQRRPKQTSVRLLRTVRDRVLEETSDHSLAELARMSGLSPSALTHAFRRHYGCTPSALKRRDRVERASRLLHNRALTVSQVAVQSGFADQAHFNREFRRVAGMPPGEYRRRCS